jgi:hypothetical protein
MLTDETKPEDFVNNRRGEYEHIVGWGIDADQKNDPTYPMKKRTNAEHRGYSWDRPALQEDSVEILKSVERPNLTAVYGTAKPPSGLSGMIRRFAYKYSESSYARWLPLMLADRINVVEGIIEDVTKGKVPHMADELGLKSEWKYNRKRMLINAAAGAVIAGIAVSIIMNQRKKKRAHVGFPHGREF